MYMIELEDTFTATHAVELPTGRWEKPHEHHWHVKALITAAKLDKNHFVADFVQTGKILRTILDDLDGKNLNTIPAIGPVPTAERVARYVFDRLTTALAHQLPTVTALAVREAEHCWAWFLA